jgi:hypothetical protein
MAYIRDNGLWKEFESVHLRNNGSWKEISQMYERYGGSWRLIWKKTVGLLDSNGNELQFPIILSGNTQKELVLTAGGDLQAEVVMWGSGAYQTGGYTYGKVQFKKDFKYLLRINYGGGSGGQGYATPNGGSGGGYAGLFEGTKTSVSAIQSQALLIAGGAGGGSGYGTGAGSGGGTTGTNGFDGGGSGTWLAGKKGLSGSQTSGGTGGPKGSIGGAVTIEATSGVNGTALQGGSGGRCGVYWQNGFDGTTVWTYYGSDGAGGGGGGYFGGGGGGGGGASGNGQSTEFIGYSGGGAGGSGYVNTTKVLTPRATGPFGGQSDPNRGGAGSFDTSTTGSKNNARVVIRLLQ